MTVWGQVEEERQRERESEERKLKGDRFYQCDQMEANPLLPEPET